MTAQKQNLYKDWTCHLCGKKARVRESVTKVVCSCRKDCQGSKSREVHHEKIYDATFIWPYFAKIGGVETWHKSLVPKLILKTSVATIEKNILDVSSISNINTFGKEETVAASARSNTIVAAAIDHIESYIPVHNRPRVIYVDHGDGSIPYFNQLFDQNKHVVDTFVCVNEYVAERYRLKHNDVRYIPNGIDPSRVASKRIATKTKYVVWVHRKADEKRPWLAHQIGESLPEGWKLVMTCDGQSTDKVQYIGIVNNPRHLYSIASAFLYTSNSDGFGLSCAEAMMSGVPVVSEPVGICNDSRLATWVPANADPKEWVEKIIQSQSFDTQQAKEIVQEKYSIEKFVESWRNLILEPFDHSKRKTAENGNDFYESCVYRGDKFGTMDCNCAGNLSVHKCEIHELCVTRKLRAGTPNIMTDAGVVTKEVTYCNRCSDFKRKE